MKIANILMVAMSCFMVAGEGSVIVADDMIRPNLSDLKRSPQDTVALKEAAKAEDTIIGLMDGRILPLLKDPAIFEEIDQKALFIDSSVYDGMIKSNLSTLQNTVPLFAPLFPDKVTVLNMALRPTSKSLYILGKTSQTYILAIIPVYIGYPFGGEIVGLLNLFRENPKRKEITLYITPMSNMGGTVNTLWHKQQIRKLETSTSKKVIHDNVELTTNLKDTSTVLDWVRGVMKEVAGFNIESISSVEKKEKYLEINGLGNAPYYNKRGELREMNVLFLSNAVIVKVKQYPFNEREWNSPDQLLTPSPYLKADAKVLFNTIDTWWLK